MTAAQIAGLIASREVSAVEVATAHLDRIAAVDERVHAFLHVDRAGALAAARSTTARSPGRWPACRSRSRT
jgi:aspartyl-tRNA(Asn)/glutamyl-tRNA(Gln) amidotransferase subunit A